MDILTKYSVLLIVSLAAGCASKKSNTPIPQIGEMDMIRNAQDLTKDQQEKMVSLYRAQAGKTEINRIELGRLKTKLFKQLLAKSINQSEIDSTKSALFSLQKKETEEMIDSLEKVAEIARSSNLDRDYLIRAFLREHRRTIENFSK